MIDVYPEDIGVEVAIDPLPVGMLPQIIRRLPKDCIVHTYGLPFSLAAEVNQELSNIIKCPRIDQWLITKSLAMMEEHFLIEDNDINNALSRLSFSDRGGFLLPVVDGQLRTLNELRTVAVESRAYEWMIDLEVQKLVCNYIQEALHELSDTRVCLYSYGAFPAYLASQQRPTIGICLCSSEAASLERFSNHFKLLMQSKLGEEELNSEAARVWKQYRDWVMPKTVDYLASTGEGLISEDSYKIITSFGDHDEISGTVLTALYATFT